MFVGIMGIIFQTENPDFDLSNFENSSEGKISNAEQIFKIVEKVGLRFPFSMRLMNVRSRPVSFASFSCDIFLDFRSSCNILPKISSLCIFSLNEIQ